MSAYMGGTRGSGVLSSVSDVLAMSVVRGVDGLCHMCMCLARGEVGGSEGEWVRGLGFAFTSPGGTCSVYCGRQIPAHLKCTQCSILLHLIDICFLTYICLLPISQIQTCMLVFLGP